METTPRATYQQGDHVCTLYSTREEQIAAAIEYVRGGLGRGERCLYVCGEHSPDEFRAALAAAGIDAAAEEKRGALLLITKHEGHLKTGAFDPYAMIAMLRTAVADALNAGFQGLCAAGDMNWVLDEAEGTGQLREYEKLLNDFYPNQRALGLCQYNRRTFPARFLDDCMATHPHVRVEGPLLLTNPFYGLPAGALSGEKGSEEIERRVRHLRVVNAA
jgi:DcmR-like sensory protein